MNKFGDFFTATAQDPSTCMPKPSKNVDGKVMCEFAEFPLPCWSTGGPSNKVLRNATAKYFFHWVQANGVAKTVKIEPYANEYWGSANETVEDSFWLDTIGEHLNTLQNLRLNSCGVRSWTWGSTSLCRVLVFRIYVHISPRPSRGRVWVERGGGGGRANNVLSPSFLGCRFFILHSLNMLLLLLWQVRERFKNAMGHEPKEFLVLDQNSSWLFEWP